MRKSTPSLTTDKTLTASTDVTAGATRAGGIFRILLAAVLVFSGLLIAAPAWADETGEPLRETLSPTPDIPDLAGEDSAAGLAPQSLEPQAVYSGDCGASGANVTWVLDTSTGILAISGSGAMASYNHDIYFDLAPWDNYRDSISHVTIANGVTSIGWNAFAYCSSLVSVTIPSSVTSIEGLAFFYCSSLTTLAIPASVETIGDGAFRGCSSLPFITVDSANAFYSSSDGVLFNKEKTKLIQFSCGNPQTSYIIPSGVTSIENWAFEGCDSLTLVTIPAGVTSIGYYAFEGCSSLASLSLPSGVTSIRGYAFSDCSSLTFFTIPSSVIEIEAFAFLNCVSLDSLTILPGVTSIGSGVFGGCTSLRSLAIPSSVTSIGEDAFSGCTSLASIAIDSANAFYSSDDYGVLFNKEGTELIRFPGGGSPTSYTIPSRVTSIAAYAFADASSLTSVVIPSSISSIEDGTFSNCSALVSLAIPSSVTSIGASAFRYCASLTFIDIPSSVISIGYQAFQGCSLLAFITIPSDVTSIGSYAFEGCAGPLNVVVPSAPVGWAPDWNYGYTGPLRWDWVGAARVTQHEGINRHDTAAKASEKAYPDPSQVDTVILAYAGDFPDALAASYLAGVLSAPILLSDTRSLDPATAAELDRLRPATIYIVGGEGVIARTIEDSLNALPYASLVIRLGGEGRTETAYKIAAEAKNKTGAPATAFVVDAANFPDALSAGSLAAGQGVPILLTYTNALDSWTKQFLTDNGIKDIIIVGGSGSVSEQVEGELQQLSQTPSVSRWSGSDRFATSRAVLDQAIAKWSLDPIILGFASGWDFPDALVGGAAIGGRGGFLAITEPDALSDAAKAAITFYKGNLSDIEIFGGTGTIRVKDEVQALCV